MASDAQAKENTALPVNRMRLSDRMKSISKGIRLFIYSEYTANKDDAAEVSEAEQGGAIVGRYVKKDGKAVETSASSDAQLSGDHAKMASAAGVKKDEIRSTTPTAVSRDMKDGKGTELGEGPTELGATSDKQADTPNKPEKTEKANLHEKVKEQGTPKGNGKPDKSLFKPTKASSGTDAGEEGDFKPEKAKHDVKPSKQPAGPKDGKPDKSMSSMASMENGPTEPMEKAYDIKAEPGKISYTKVTPEAGNHQPKVGKDANWHKRWSQKPQAEKTAFAQKLAQDRPMKAGTPAKPAQPATPAKPPLAKAGDDDDRLSRVRSNLEKLHLFMSRGKQEAPKAEAQGPKADVLRMRGHPDAQKPKPKARPPMTRDEKIKAALEAQKGTNPYASAGPGGGKRYDNSPAFPDRAYANQETSANTPAAPEKGKLTSAMKMLQLVRAARKGNPKQVQTSAQEQVYRMAHGDEIADLRQAHDKVTATEPQHTERVPGSSTNVSYHGADDQGRHHFSVSGGRRGAAKSFAVQKNPAGKWDITHIPDNVNSWVMGNPRMGDKYTKFDLKRAANEHLDSLQRYRGKGVPTATQGIKRSAKFAEIVGKDAQSARDFHPKDFEVSKFGQGFRARGKHGPHKGKMYTFSHDPATNSYQATNLWGARDEDMGTHKKVFDNVLGTNKAFQAHHKTPPTFAGSQGQPPKSSHLKVIKSIQDNMERLAKSILQKGWRFTTKPDPSRPTPPVATAQDPAAAAPEQQAPMAMSKAGWQPTPHTSDPRVMNKEDDPHMQHATQIAERSRKWINGRPSRMHKAKEQATQDNAHNDVVSQIHQAHSAKGGSTFNLKSGHVGGDLYAVSPYLDRSQVIKGQLTPQHISGFVKQNADLLQKPGHNVGTWHDPSDGNHYLDISVTSPHKEHAIALARKHNQKAIFHLGTMQTIPTGGTGLK